MSLLRATRDEAVRAHTVARPDSDGIIEVELLRARVTSNDGAAGYTVRVLDDAGNAICTVKACLPWPPNTTLTAEDAVWLRIPRNGIGHPMIIGASGFGSDDYTYFQSIWELWGGLLQD